jgi:hypothetical protein
MPGYRLLIPYLPLWAALAICGGGGVADRLRCRTIRFAAFAAGLVLALFLWQTRERGENFHHVTIRANGYIGGHTALADWLNEQTDPGDTIALMDIGIVGYRCIDRHILDITGLTDRFIAKSPGSFLNKDYDPAYVFNRKTTYLVIAAGAPEGPLDQSDMRRVVTWTKGEGRLCNTALFRKYFVRPRPFRPEMTRVEQLAAGIGAERAFLHDHPKRYYVLLAFRYHERE